MKEIAREVECWRARGEKVAIATVVATRLSAPRPVGAKFAVSESGELAGSVSGGCVEGDVFEHAQEVLATGVPKLLTYGISDDDAMGVGLPCGGEIDVFVERSIEFLVFMNTRSLVDRLLEVAASDERAVLFTVLEGPRPGAKLLWLESGETLGDGPAELAALAPELRRSGLVEHEGLKVFADVFGPPPRLVVVGAVDTAEALCAAAKLLGWRTACVDARAKFATKKRIPSADELVVAWPEEAFERLRPDHDAAVVVLTHDEKFDTPALKAALATDAFYIGAIGARRTQGRRRERLLEAGVTEAELERIHGPSGLDVGAGTPAETALSILAEALAVRAGRPGTALKSSPDRIHVEG